MDITETTNDVHSDYGNLMKDLLLEQLSHIGSTRDLWDSIWCNLIAGCLPSDLSVGLRDTIERVSLLYATALRCTTRLSRQQLDVRYNCLIARMHEMRKDDNQASHQVIGTKDKEDLQKAPNSIVCFIQSNDILCNSDWIASPHTQHVKGLQWRPACSVYGTDHIMNMESCTYFARSSLLAAAWSMILIHPKHSSDFITVSEITESIRTDTKSPFFDDCSMKIQTELMRWIFIRAKCNHATTFENHMADILCESFRADIYRSIAIREHAFFVPIPSVYTAFIVDLLIEHIGHIPAGIGKYYAPNATPLERWCIFTRYHMAPVTRSELLDNWPTDQLQKLEHRQYIYNASTWDDDDI